MTSSSFAEAAAQTLHTSWCYKLSGLAELRLVVLDGATRDQVLQHLERKFPEHSVEYVKPAAGGAL